MSTPGVYRLSISFGLVALSLAVPVKDRNRKLDQNPRRQPRYHVRLWDDDKHTFIYVIRMLRELFGHTLDRAKRLAEQVDSCGSVVCLTTTREHAELKHDQIQAFGKDERVGDCKGAMSCSIEPED